MRRSAVIILILLSQLAAPSAQFAVLGRGMAQGVSTSGPPCDVVSGCVAAYSLRRYMLAAYSGPLFQLTRTGGGGGTQDIGLVGGVVDQTTINTFCGGAPSGSGTSTTTVNGCQFTKIYNHTSQGSSNDLLGTRPDYLSCYTRYTQDAGGNPIWISDVNANHCFLGAKVPTGTPTGNDAISIYAVWDDTFVPVTEAPFRYGMTFGMLHHTDQDGFVCCGNGSDFDLNLRGGLQPAATTFGDIKNLTFGVDLEDELVEFAIGIADSDATEAALAPNNVAKFSYVGKSTGFTSYDPATTNIYIDWMKGRRTATVNWTATNHSGMTAIQMGADDFNVAHLAEIRMGWTGDSTGFDPAAFYEGAIYKATKTSTDGTTLQQNARTFYGITDPTPCSNGGIDLLGGSNLGSGNGVVSGAWGLRQLDPTIPGPVAVISRADTGALKVIGTTSGSCTVDVSGVSSFCSGTICHIYDLPNQVLSLAAITHAWGGSYADTGRLLASSATAGPTITLNGLNGTLPVMTCGGTDLLTSFGTTNAVTRPWTIAAAAKRTSTGGTLFTDGAGTNLLYNGGSNLLGVQSSSGTQTASATDGTWHAVAGTVVGGVLKAYVNGAASTSGTVTTGDTASSTWKACNGWTGAFTELYLLNATDAGATAIGNLSTLQRAIGAY